MKSKFLKAALPRKKITVLLQNKFTASELNVIHIEKTIVFALIPLLPPKNFQVFNISVFIMFTVNTAMLKMQIRETETQDNQLFSLRTHRSYIDYYIDLLVCKFLVNILFRNKLIPFRTTLKIP